HPLGPSIKVTSLCQCVSAFAGNPLLISLDRLIDDGLLTTADVGATLNRPTDPVAFPAVIAHREALWARVLERFDAFGASPMHQRFERFRLTQAHSFDDYTLFLARQIAHRHAPRTAL